MYRDQPNLGKYGQYGYGVLVYDVTDLIKDGEKIEVQRITSDGEPIACFLCPELCSIYHENVKICFYSDGEYGI